MRHEDRCTLLRNEEDRDILTRKLFDVNMRLFHVNPDYRSVVQGCCKYIRGCAVTEVEGYKKPHGFSGANAGIPFNIIALADGTVMINPRIVASSGERESMSNCGSLLLPQSIKITRHADVTVRYFDSNGFHRMMIGYLPTVQHEIDHNDGILITDRIKG